jgi:hypothetical protein
MAIDVKELYTAALESLKDHAVEFAKEESGPVREYIEEYLKIMAEEGAAYGLALVIGDTAAANEHESILRSCQGNIQGELIRLAVKAERQMGLQSILGLVGDLALKFLPKVAKMLLLPG